MKTPYKMQSRDRILTDDDLRRIWHACPRLGAFGCIVQMLILTGCRRSEIANLRREWVQDDLLVIPKEHTKGKREHIVPLVDGVVLAQPLFASNAKVKGVRQPVLIIATSNNDVYAFSPLENRPVPLWHRRIDAPLVSGEGHAACVPNELAAWQEPGTFSAGGLDGLFGIESTPVIDATNNRVLVSYKTADSVQHLAALDLNDGSIIKSSGSISCKRVAPPASKPSKLASFGRRRLRRFFEFMRGNTYSNARLD